MKWNGIKFYKLKITIFGKVTAYTCFNLEQKSVNTLNARWFLLLQWTGESKRNFTTWGWQGTCIFLAPSNRVNVRGGDVTPVIIHILPAIKVNQYFVSKCVCYSGHTNECSVFTVNCLKFHSYTKCTWCHWLQNKNEIYYTLFLEIS